MELSTPIDMASYAFKRIIRTWKLFLALFIGVTLAATLFSGVNIGADSIGIQFISEALEQVPIDIVIRTNIQKIYPENVTSIISTVKPVEGVGNVDAVIRLSGLRPELPSGNLSERPFQLLSISNDSIINDGISVVNGTTEYLSTMVLGINETIVDIDSIEAEKLSIGDNLTVNIQVENTTGTPKFQVYSFNLTVVGFVDLEDKEFSLAWGQSPQQFLRNMLIGGVSIRPAHNLMIIRNDTLFNHIDLIYNENLTLRGSVTTDIFVNFNREIINPWDIDATISESSNIQRSIINRFAVTFMPQPGQQPGQPPAPGGFGRPTIFGFLTFALNQIQNISGSMRIDFIMMALPVFFMAWYMGKTVSEIAFNSRRREVALLLTKGLSKRQVFSLFLSEAVFIGLAGGVLGLVLGVSITPMISGYAIVGIESMIMVLVFSVCIALLAIFQPALKTSKLKVVDALREYFYTEEPSPYRKIWPMLALAIGSLKIVLILTGTNLTNPSTLIGGVMGQPLGGRPPGGRPGGTPGGVGPGGNLFVMILNQVLGFFDGVLNFLGPILFFWGFSKVFISGSTKFQEVLAKFTGKFMGDLSQITTVSVKRHMPRVVAIAFLVALITGYSISVIGGIASAEDYITRDIYQRVGADIRVALFSHKNASIIAESMGNLSGVESLSIEREFYGDTEFDPVGMRCVNTSTWASTAHYENDWFSGSDVHALFQYMDENNETIILDRRMAEEYGLEVGENITVDLNDYTYGLQIIGLFGPEQVQTNIALPPGEAYIPLWSYVSEEFYNMTGGIASQNTRLLLNVAEDSNITILIDEIQEVSDEIQFVQSAVEILSTRSGSILLSGSATVQKLGIPFAVLSSTIGILTITYVTMLEKEKEIVLMNMRGLSFKQLAWMTIVENLGIIIFSLILGVVVGYIFNIGNVTAPQMRAFNPLVSRRVIFSDQSILSILGILILLIASAILPIIYFVKRSTSKLGRRM